MTFMSTGDPRFFNRYAYTFNNPINLIDPTGKAPDTNNSHSSAVTLSEENKDKYYGRSRPVSGKIAVKGNGQAPAGGRSFADGRYDKTGANRYRISSTGAGRPHKGIDLEATKGDSVTAPGAGEVVRADGSSKSFGNQVVLKHSDGTFSKVTHLDSVSVSKGDFVTHRQTVGTAGNSGNASNRPVHVHFETGTQQVGGQIDPDVWIANAPIP